MQTVKECQARIEQLEAAIRLMNRRCNEYEGTSILQFCSEMDAKDEYYDLIKGVISQPE